jgi:hypothetical protein
VEQRYLDRYEGFLEHLATRRDEIWQPLPRDVARWWRQREALSVDEDGAIAGSADYDATVADVTERDGRVVIER